jgi:hypothetical protein
MRGSGLSQRKQTKKGIAVKKKTNVKIKGNTVWDRQGQYLIGKSIRRTRTRGGGGERNRTQRVRRGKQRREVLRFFRPLPLASFGPIEKRRSVGWPGTGWQSKGNLMTNRIPLLAFLMGFSRPPWDIRTENQSNNRLPMALNPLSEHSVRATKRSTGNELQQYPKIYRNEGQNQTRKKKFRRKRNNQQENIDHQ